MLIFRLRDEFPNYVREFNITASSFYIVLAKTYRRSPDFRRVNRDFRVWKSAVAKNGRGEGVWLIRPDRLASLFTAHHFVHQFQRSVTPFRRCTRKSLRTHTNERRADGVKKINKIIPVKAGERAARGGEGGSLAGHTRRRGLRVERPSRVFQRKTHGGSAQLNAGPVVARVQAARENGSTTHSGGGRRRRRRSAV